MLTCRRSGPYASDSSCVYRRTAIAGADPHTFPPDEAVTNCSDTSISFAEWMIRRYAGYARSVWLGAVPKAAL